MLKKKRQRILKKGDRITIIKDGMRCEGVVLKPVPLAPRWYVRTPVGLATPEISEITRGWITTEEPR